MSIIIPNTVINFVTSVLGATKKEDKKASGSNNTAPAQGEVFTASKTTFTESQAKLVRKLIADLKAGKEIKPDADTLTALTSLGETLLANKTPLTHEERQLLLNFEKIKKGELKINDAQTKTFEGLINKALNPPKPGDIKPPSQADLRKRVLDQMPTLRGLIKSQTHQEGRKPQAPSPQESNAFSDLIRLDETAPKNVTKDEDAALFALFQIMSNIVKPENAKRLTENQAKILNDLLDKIKGKQK